jgi:uncharacterized membrane protein
MIRAGLFSIFVGVVGAALLHVIIVLSLPSFTGIDAYTKLSAYDADQTFVRFGAKPDTMGFSNGDPYLRSAACLFSVASQPVHLTAEGKVPFWSFAVYDSDSNEVFSMNDRSQAGGDLDAIIASPDQLAAIRKSNPDVISESVLIEMPRPEGYIVLRALAPSPSLENAANTFLDSAQCGPE